MSNWGIAETAPKEEKIKAEFFDVLNGLNSTGVIDYVVYCQLFDKFEHVSEKLTKLKAEKSGDKKHCWIFVTEECGNPMDGIDYNWGWKCSSCNLWWEYDDYSDDVEQEPNANYCPNCGAKMKEGD